ncbi:hypothetical protein DB30_03015 [Enhygromyxa salina]|uniref:Uncharacterized protein n=1 Tax=Enhygromyxa salina TaxID=215803 RepID=A0A0C2CUT4_9BACT|nr:hypothetical protein [Enhygromyxa salina]KIG11647.1 hypothetical protein DB30_03015 [Enhygromyxa salina]
MQAIHIDTTYTATLQTNGNDFHGYVRLTNTTNETLYVTVTPTSDAGEDLCPTPANVEMAGGGVMYLPMAAVGTTTLAFDVRTSPTGAAVASSSKVQGFIASPLIKSVDPWETWHHATVNGFMRVRNDSGIPTNVTIASQTYPVGGHQHDAGPWEVPSNETTVTLTDTSTGTSKTVALTHQSNVVSISNVAGAGSDLGADSLVFLAGATTTSVTVINNSADTLRITPVDFDGTQGTDYTLAAWKKDSPARRMVTVDITPNTNHFQIEKQAIGGSFVSVASSTDEPLKPFTGFGPVVFTFDDPVVVVKHTGCDGGEG